MKDRSLSITARRQVAQAKPRHAQQTDEINNKTSKQQQQRLHQDIGSAAGHIHYRYSEILPPLRMTNTTATTFSFVYPACFSRP